MEWSAFVGRIPDGHQLANGKFQGGCPLCAREHGGEDSEKNLVAQQAAGRITVVCFGGHPVATVLAALGLQQSDLVISSPSPPTAGVSAQAPRPHIAAEAIGNPQEPSASPEPPTQAFHVNGNAQGTNGSQQQYVNEPGADEEETKFQEDLLRWKAQILPVAQTLLERDLGLRKLEGEALFKGLVEGLLPLPTQLRGYEPPALLPAHLIRGELEEIARHLVPITQPQERRNGHLITEDDKTALVINEEYLARPAVIDRLGYAQAIMLMIGGKHHGKTTNIRTMALSISRGLPIWGRATTPGHVIYVASDDEVASTRNELLKMGWTKERDSLTLVHIDPESDAEPEQVLEDIANLAEHERPILIILDMLFDFVPIRDELSYAGTRAAIGMVQRLADRTKALVVGSHHTPKYLTDAHDATNAALGSQGISARFSPIVFTRKWAPTLYSVESTTTRDPRGEQLKSQRIARNDNGWIEVVEDFKEWMKWEIYAARVLDLFEANKGYTAFEVSQRLNLDNSRANLTLKQLVKEEKLIREKQGRRYVYYLKATDMFQREGGNWSDA